MPYQITVALILFLFAMAIALSAGVRRGLLSAPFWWALGSIIYTFPGAMLAFGGLQNPTLSATVGIDSVGHYAIFVAVISVGFAGGWRIAIKSAAPEASHEPLTLNLGLGRLYSIQLAGLCAVISGTVLSGISPMLLLTTITEEGYNYYQPGEFKYRILLTLGMPLLVYIPPIAFVVAIRNAGSVAKFVAVANLVVFALLATLAGVRANLLIMLTFTLLLLLAIPKNQNQRTAFRPQFIVIGSLTVVSFYFLANWMEQARGQELALRENGSSFWTSFDLTTPSASVVEWVNITGPVLLGSVSDLIPQLIPSFIDPSKGRAEFLQLVDSMNSNGAGAAVSSGAELYYNMGPLLPVVALFVLGLLVGSWQQKVETHSTRPSQVLFFVLLGPLTLHIFTRGYLFSTIVTLAGAWIATRAIGYFASIPADHQELLAKSDQITPRQPDSTNPRMKEAV